MIDLELDLLPITARLVVSVESYAWEINNNFGSALILPQDGYYFRNSIEPVLLLDKTYTHICSGDVDSFKKNTVRNKITDVSAQDIMEKGFLPDDGYIYDPNTGRTILNAYSYKNRFKTIQLGTEDPIIEKKLIALSVDEFIVSHFNCDKSVIYSRSRSRLIQNLFVNDEAYDQTYETSKYREDRYFGSIQEVLKPLYNTVSEFMKSDNNHIYFMREIGYDLYIEKTIDYRIYDWELNRRK